MLRRKLPIKEFDDHVRAKRITDAMIEDFGDGYGEPYNPNRRVIGTLNGGHVRAIQGDNCEGKDGTK